MMAFGQPGRPLWATAASTPLYWTVLGLFLVSACFFWRLGMSAQAGLERLGYTTYHLDGDVPTADSYEEMARTERRSGSTLSFALWTQKDRQLVETPATGRTAAVSILMVAGDVRLALASATGLNESDFSGCLIDRDTAIDLFGKGDPSGQAVQYDGREYAVRDVIDRPQATMVIRPEPSLPTPLDAVTVTAGPDAGEFIMRHGLVQSYAVSSAAYASAAGLLGSLPMAALLLMLLEFLCSLLLRHRNYPVRHCLLTALLLAVSTAAFLLLLHALPPDLIPSRWSDFTFWRISFANIKTQLLLFFTMPKYRQDLLAAALCLHALWSFLSLFLLLLARRWLYQGHTVLLCTEPISPPPE